MKKIYLILSVLSFLLYSCYDDKGNYDYRDINELKISGLPEGEITKIKNGDTLQIDPVIEGTLTDEGDYEYTWTAVLQGGQGEATQAIEIGKGKKLNYFVELPLGKYFIYLNVLDRNTQVTWRQKFDLNVSIATSAGWIVLCGQQGETRLDMISQVGESEKMLRNLLKDFNMTNKKGPEKILYTLNYNGAGSPYVRIILITQTGACYLDPEALTWEEAFDLKYEMGMLPENFRPTYIASINPRSDGTSRNILLTTDEVYCKKSYNTYIYELPRNYIDGQTFKAAPFVITSAEDYFYQWEPPVILYDMDHKQFVQLNTAWDGTSCWVPVVKNPVFEMATGKDFVYAANTKQSSASSFAILRDAQQKLWLHGFGDIYNNSFSQLASYYYPLEATNIEQARLFAIHNVVDHQIYQFDLINKTCRQVTPLDKEGKPIDFSGEEITFIKFNPLQCGPYKLSEENKQIEYRLLVGSDKGGENGGIIRMFDIPERMSNDITLYKEYTGFAKPVDIVYRERP